MHADLKLQTYLANTPILFDEDGFILEPDLWTETLAENIATDLNIKQLTPAHWQIIKLVREKHLTLGSILPMRTICRKTGLERDAVKGLFGGCKNLWRVAGLPNPGEEAKTYMD